MADISSRQEDAVEHADVIIQAAPKRKWQSYIWDSLDKSPEERKFLFKLDWAVLNFASLGYLIKYLDQANVNNAFVSGICWAIGYVIGQIPSNLILTRVRPSMWITSLEVTWTILTFTLCKCNTAGQLYAVRFLVGLAESGFYPGMQYLIGSWYRRDELAKRSCIFHTTSAVASMFSGYLMAAVYNLDGVGGFKGWQWLFIMDGVISMPIALSGYVLLPDLPNNCRALYLTPEERAFGRKRMELEGRKGRQPFTRAKVASYFKTWHIYALVLLYVTFNNGNHAAAPVYAQYLKDDKTHRYEIWQINVYPTITYAVQVVTTLAHAWSSDTICRGARWPPIIFGGCMNILCYISLAVWNIPTSYKWACFIMMGCGGGLSGLCYAWAHEICSDDNEERALVAGAMNEMAYVLQAWLPLIVWQQVDAPEYRKGYVTITCLSVVLIITAFVTRFLHKRQTREYVAMRPSSKLGEYVLTDVPSKLLARESLARHDITSEDGFVEEHVVDKK